MTQSKDVYKRQVLYISAMMTLGLVIVFMIPIPDIPCKNAGKRKEETHSDTLPFQKALKVLLHNKTYLLFLFSALGFNICLLYTSRCV